MDDLDRRLINAKYETGNTFGIAYIYCNFKRKHEQKLEDLSSSLLKQLVQVLPALPSAVKSLYGEYARKRTRPKLREIIEVLQSVIVMHSKVFIIIDALDECQTSDGCREQFLSMVFDFQAISNVNLFATSRHIPDIEERFEESLRLEIRASEEDIHKYLDIRMQHGQLPRFVRDDLTLREEISANIVKAVDGM